MCSVVGSIDVLDWVLRFINCGLQKESEMTTQIKRYEATVRLEVEQSETTWWNGESIADEIASWLEDLGFDVQVTVKEVEE